MSNISLTTSVTKRVLSNGLTLLAQPVPSADVVSVATHVRAGYFHEPDEWVGIAHVLEHMFFKGTDRRGPGEIAGETQRLGGYLNASTIYDKTVYWVVLPATNHALEHGVDVQADALLHCALDPGELMRELAVIIQEVKRKLDNPPALVTETLYQSLFRAHRMRRWRIGTEDGLRRLTAGDLRSFYESRYTPDRVIVAAVGRLDAGEALDLMERQYGGWVGAAAKLDAGPEESAERGSSFRVLRGDVARPLAAVGWRTVGTMHADTPALDVASVIAGSGRGSRLWRHVRAPGLASTVAASHYTPTEVGVFELSLEADPERLDDAVVGALSAVTDLARTPPEPGEMARARALIATHWAKRVETMDGRATLLCEFEALGDFLLADGWLERTLAVSAEDVCGVAWTHLVPDAACGVVYLRDGDQTRFPPDQWPPIPSARARTEAVRAGGPVATPGRKRGTPRTEHPGPGLTQVRLDGADLVVCPRTGAGLVSLSLSVLGLRQGETETTAGLTALLVRSALRGAGGMDAEALAMAAETLGGAVAAAAGGDAAGWSLTVPAGSAGSAARLLVTLARQAHLADADVTVERGLLATDAARARDDMFGHPLQRVLGQAFPRHHYGLPVLGHPEHVPDLDAVSVRRAAERLHRAPTVLIAAGDLPEDALVDLLAQAWGDADGSSAVRPESGPITWNAGRGSESREKAQTALAMAFPAHRFSVAAQATVEVLCSLLSGMAGRLFRALRDQRSLAYTVTAAPWFRKESGAVLTYIATSPEREHEARAAMLEELDRVSRDPIEGVEFERARNYAAGLVQVRRQRVAAWAGEILEAYVQGTLGNLESSPSRLRAVSPDEVVVAAGRIFRADRRAEYVVRGGDGG